MKKKLFTELPRLHGSRVALRPLEQNDAHGLQALVNSPAVYRNLPTFLFEKKCEEVQEVIRRLYTENLKDSIILGIFMEDRFCGLGEFYGYRDPIHKISVGYRLLEECWGYDQPTIADKWIL